MRSASASMLVLSLAACGDADSSVADVDASSDAANEHNDAYVVRRDAAPDTRPPPLPGEIPTLTEVPCEDFGQGGQCPGSSRCNQTTGWCCNGDFYAGGECRCGATLGCGQWESCCPWSIHPYPRCVQSEHCP